MNSAQQSKEIKNKVGLLRLAEQLDSVAYACSMVSVNYRHRVMLKFTQINKIRYDNIPNSF